MLDENRCDENGKDLKRMEKLGRKWQRCDEYDNVAMRSTGMNWGRLSYSSLAKISARLADNNRYQENPQELPTNDYMGNLFTNSVLINAN